MLPLIAGYDYDPAAVSLSISSSRSVNSARMRQESAESRPAFRRFLSALKSAYRILEISRDEVAALEQRASERRVPGGGAGEKQSEGRSAGRDLGV